MLIFISSFLGHKDSVTCTGFSHDGVYVATADLSGLIKVWKVETKEEIWSFECSDIEVPVVCTWIYKPHHEKT